ncbi:hypothetical protein V8C86DRAFT_680336 [Haematococcus lacustris]
MSKQLRRSDAPAICVRVEAPSATLEPVPGISLLDLPAPLLDDVARWAIQLGAGGTLSLTCRAFFKTNLLHAPALHIQLDSQRCDQLLTPRVVAALQARTCQLALSLEQPQAQSSREYIRLLTEALKKLANCAAVEACRLAFIQDPSHAPHMPLDCSRSLAQHLMDTFPGLTSLSLDKYAIPCSGLTTLLSHPQLSLQLQQLDLSSTTILQAKRPEPGAATLETMFHASRLKQLSLAAAAHNLTSCSVSVRIKVLHLDVAGLQHVKLQQLEASLQALNNCSWETISVTHMNVGAANVATLAPLCQGCTKLEFAYSSLTPSLEFWRQLLQLMPTVTHLTFSKSDGSASAAMHQSLKRMAEQPWARWLDICIARHTYSDSFPASWRASPLSQPGKFRVWFKS